MGLFDNIFTSPQKKGLQLINVIRNGDIQKARVLIENGADINTKDGSGETPLHLASEWAHLEIVKLLIEKGADLNVKDDLGFTPLISNLRWGNVNTTIAQHLIENGADLNTKNEFGLTPLHFASGQGFRPDLTSKSVYLEIGQLLIEKGAVVNAKSQDSNTALHYATRNGFYEMVKLLIKKGADLNAKDHAGYTALQIASNKGYSEIVLVLNEKGSIISEKNCKRCGGKVFSQNEFLYECGKAGLLIIDGNLFGGSQDDGKVETYRKLENQKGFLCMSCHNIYCMSCIFDYAPTHPNGGKACFNCRGSFKKYE